MSGFSEYQEKIVNRLGYFGLSRTRIGTISQADIKENDGESPNSKEYYLETTSTIAKWIFWLCYFNVGIKAVFLAFLITDYLGPLEFLDKIAGLDYILCVGVITLSSSIWFFRYPFYEVLHSFWKIENSIFHALGQPEDLKRMVDKRHRATVWIHLGINWFGSSILVTQFYADPKYCVWTYSALEADNWYLRIIFVAHEFLFMTHGWYSMTCSSSLCTFQGIVLSNLIEKMTLSLEGFRMEELEKGEPGIMHSKAGVVFEKTKHISVLSLSSSSVLTSKYGNVDELIVHYKQLMLISERFNVWVSYKIVFLHACGYCQFISDVFVAMQILKIPGAEIWDVWFFIEDSIASMYMIYRVYKFMSRVRPASIDFLNALKSYVTVNVHDKRLLRKTIRTLKPVSLKLGPCPVTPMTVLQAMDMLGNYYVCVALWD